MRLLQITDLHIGLPDAETYGIDTRQNFLNLLTKVREEAPDYLVVSGDICLDTGNAEVYAFVKQELDDLDIPYFVISGNHDDPALLAAAFELDFHLHEGAVYYATSLEHWSVLFLDTTTAVVDDAQLSWLDTELELRKGPLVVFMHHPPIQAGVPFMDGKHALKNGQEVLTRLERYADPVSVFCGHYHTARSIRVGNVDVHITPSAYFQIDPRETNFAIDHRRVGYRLIYLKENQIEHGVWYVDE